MNGFNLGMAFLMGLTGSLHCAGMCGPIVLVMPFQQLNGIRKWAGILLYHGGRISMYALLGLLLHSFGAFFDPQLQQYISICIGSLLLVAGLLSLFPTRAMSFTLPWTEFVRTQLGRFMGHPNITSLFITGALNGLLPCGMVYMALSAAVVAGSATQSVMLMAAFGGGTLPMLLALTLLKNKAGFHKFVHFRKLVPFLMLAFGGLFVLRGMNLGIPYLSPEMPDRAGTPAASCYHP